MPRIIVTAPKNDIETAIDEIEIIAKEVFGLGPNSILPMPAGTVEIVPNPVNRIFSEKQRVIDIFLYQNNRATKTIDEIAKAFKNEKTIAKVNASPEKLWRLI